MSRRPYAPHELPALPNAPNWSYEVDEGTRFGLKTLLIYEKVWGRRVGRMQFFFRDDRKLDAKIAELIVADHPSDLWQIYFEPGRRRRPGLRLVWSADDP
ncbi:MAG: hypothetical protein H6851_07675 [Geminicoccaceae bacterium]|nr:hypothetical protein [Geminicoccaceae bacterium]